MFHKALFKAYVCAFLILVACLLPSRSLPEDKTFWPGSDKLVHVLMYVTLAWTLAYGFKLQTLYHVLQKWRLFWAFGIAGLYGGLVELLQFALTADRAAEFHDLVANAAGAILGILTIKVGECLILFWNKKRNALWVYLQRRR